MSAPSSNCCSTPLVLNTPGPAGADGAAGAAGTNGQNAFTLTTANFVIPAVAANVTILVASSAWMAIGQHVIASDGTHIGNFSVASLPSTSSVQLTFLGYSGDSAVGVTITSGAIVSPSGYKMTLAAALPTALTDNSGGTQSNTIAVGVGVTNLTFYVNLTDLAAADLITTFTLGYKFKILAMSFIVDKPATTAGKAVTITPKISGVAVTGGVLNLTSANCTPQGTVVAGSAVTAANTGSNSATISLTGSALTAFVEGSGWFAIRIQSMDDADAIASLSKHVNDLISSLT